MRLVEEFEKPEDHYTEGELDLEAPEELALGELDDDAMLEEELDNDDVNEEDVDEVVLEMTLEELVHSGDSEDDRSPDPGAGSGHSELQVHEIDVRPAGERVNGSHGSQPLPDDDEETEDLEVAELEDLEESLDRILADRLAGDTEAEGEPEEDELSPNGALPVILAPAGGDWNGASTCRHDEFVCSSCFLVRKRVQLSETSRGVCRDCSS